MSMRVYELAKKLGIENRDLLPELKKMGVTVASHSSALDASVVQKVLEKLAPKNRAAGGAEVGVRPKAAGSVHDAAGAAKSGAAKPQAIEEPAKPDKRRILIKRKKEDEPEVVASSPSEAEHAASWAAPSGVQPSVPGPLPAPFVGDDAVPPVAEPPAQIQPAPVIDSPPAPLQEAVPAKPPAVSPAGAAATLEPVTAKKRVWPSKLSRQKALRTS